MAMKLAKNAWGQFIATCEQHKETAAGSPSLVLKMAIRHNDELHASEFEDWLTMVDNDSKGL